MKYSPQTTEEEFKEAARGFQDWSSSTLFSEDESGASIISPHMNASWNKTIKQLRSGHVTDRRCSVFTNHSESRWLIITNRSVRLTVQKHFIYFMTWTKSRCHFLTQTTLCLSVRVNTNMSDLVIDDFNNEGAARARRHLLSVLQILLRRQQDTWMWSVMVGAGNTNWLLRGSRGLLLNQTPLKNVYIIQPHIQGQLIQDGDSSYE